MHDAWNVTELILQVLGAVGIITALFLTWRTHAERATFEMIDRLYTLGHELHLTVVKDWRLAHLKAVRASDYEKTKAIVSAGLSDEQKSEYAVKELMLAIHIFNVYEHVYYQWKTSSRIWLPGRKTFLDEMLKYFTERLLVNPRLAAILDSDLTGVSLHLESESKDYLDKNLKRPESLDPDGPFVLTD